MNEKRSEPSPGVRSFVEGEREEVCGSKEARRREKENKEVLWWKFR